MRDKMDEVVELVELVVEAQDPGMAALERLARTNARCAGWGLVLWCPSEPSLARALRAELGQRLNAYHGRVAVFAWRRHDRGDAHWVVLPLPALAERPDVIPEDAAILHVDGDMDHGPRYALVARIGYDPLEGRETDPA